MEVYVDVDADVHVNEICRSLQKLWTLGKIIPLWPRRALPAAGMFPRSPLCPFLPIRLQVCPYGESRVSVLISSHQACMFLATQEPEKALRAGSK